MSQFPCPKQPLLWLLCIVSGTHRAVFSLFSFWLMFRRQFLAEELQWHDNCLLM
jgi:hypothetical protein